MRHDSQLQRTINVTVMLGFSWLIQLETYSVICGFGELRKGLCEHRGRICLARHLDG